MTDKEFKQLNRPQLIDIIYQLQLQVDKLTEEKQAFERALVDKRLRIDSAGSLAEAVLEINNCFQSAQKAADQYLSEIKAMREDAKAERLQILGEARVEADANLAAARAEAEAILAAARAEAGAILSGAQQERAEYDSALEAVLQEYRQDHSDNG